MGSRRRYRTSRRRVFRRDQHSLQSSFYSSMRILCRAHLGTAAPWPSSTTPRHGLWVHRLRTTRGSPRTRLYRCSRSGSGPAEPSSMRRRRPLSTLPGTEKRVEMPPRRSDLKGKRFPQRGSQDPWGDTRQRVTVQCTPNGQGRQSHQGGAGPAQIEGTQTQERQAAGQELGFTGGYGER
jgi:hypothetical protein